MKCPCCKGSGTINKNILHEPPRRREMARKMRGLGFTFSEIMRALNYKSPRSISQALSRKD